MFVHLLALLACSDPMEITSVDPAEVQAGERVKVLGSGFAEGVTVALGSPEGPVPLEGVRVPGAVIVEGRIPETVKPGTYDLVVSREGKDAVLPQGLTIAPVPVDVPCAGEYTANTQLSLARKEVVVDRFYRSGERETLRVPLGDVERVEYELVKMDDGQLCSAIFMRRKDGSRLMFDDDTKVDLKDRAYALGRDMGRPVDVLREDAEGMDAAGDAD